MGILSMMGLVTAEEYGTTKSLAGDLAKERNQLHIDLAAEREARGIVERELSSATRQFQEAVAALTNERSDLATARDTIKTLRGQIADLTPDAEAMRAKRRRDVEQKTDKRKAVAAINGAAKDAIDNGVLKTAPATGKRRTGIPAKADGKTRSATVGKPVAAKVKRGAGK